ncbi:hypothetical protein [Mesorhizobium sp. B4-1-4]|uniref:hypothetical protein n=1 Tax=Mesorhizobium sp. B4-1-4 TaxID=2589888 RepID=UPI001D019FFB|nr:hypothetical protein [Mesorhizobium sp. B4-1-4]UCI34557.1 hypothetical protein FJW03_14525 [Mesorhizobium sp. B4-1-4]
MGLKPDFGQGRAKVSNLSGKLSRLQRLGWALHACSLAAHGSDALRATVSAVEADAEIPAVQPAET